MTFVTLAALVTGTKPGAGKFGVKVEEYSLANINGDLLTLLSLLYCVPNILICVHGVM